MPRLPIVFAAALALAACTTGYASADMNVMGSYVVKTKCKGVSEGQPVKVTSGFTLLISQTGNVLSMTALGTSLAGNLIPDSETPDEKAFGNMVACGINDSLSVGAGYDNWLGSFSLKGKDGVRKIKGTLVESAATPFTRSLVCKMKGKQIDSIDAGVSGCNN